MTEPRGAYCADLDGAADAHVAVRVGGEADVEAGAVAGDVVLEAQGCAAVRKALPHRRCAAGARSRD